MAALSFADRKVEDSLGTGRQEGAAVRLHLLPSHAQSPPPATQEESEEPELRATPPPHGRTENPNTHGPERAQVGYVHPGLS